MSGIISQPVKKKCIKCGKKFITTQGGISPLLDNICGECQLNRIKKIFK